METTTKNAIVAEITAAVMQTLMAKGLIELDEQKPKKAKSTKRLPDGKSATISDILSDAKAEARENGKKVYEVQEKGLTIMEYSERSYAIVGDTKGLKDFLKERGAYRYAVVYGFADNTAKGWLVSKKKFDEACKGLEAFKRDMDSKGYHVTIGESLKAINEAYKAEHPREEKGEKKKISTFEKSYQILKEKHPDAILLFRAGDFYETYFNDAKVVSEILGIVLTNQGDKDMAGFPHHSLDIYLPALIRAGKRVIICDPIEDGGINKKEVYRQGGTTFVTEQKDKTVNVVPLQQSESFEGVGYTPKKTVKGEFEHTVMDNVFKHGNGFYMCIGSDNGENNFLFVAGGNVENDKEKMERIATIAKEGLPQAYSKGIVKKIYQWQMDAYKVADKESYEWLKSHVKEISA